MTNKTDFHAYSSILVSFVYACGAIVDSFLFIDKHCIP